jgi:hypothetical protein
VGLTEARARAAGHDIRVGRFPFIGNGKAIALGEPEGMVKTIFDARTGELLGAHMIGAEVTEMIQGYTIARTLEATEAELMHTVFPHPTVSETMHEAVLDAYGRAIHFSQARAPPSTRWGREAPDPVSLRKDFKGLPLMGSRGKAPLPWIRRSRAAMPCRSKSGISRRCAACAHTLR